jgi:AcrR family transcriptional regulator
VKRSSVLDLDSVLAGLTIGTGPAGSIGLDRVRESLLDATSALLTERGAGGWSVEDAAARAAVGRATVYRRFTGREQLIAETIRRDARRFFAAISDSVASVPGLEDKVVAGFATGVELARHSALGNLLRRDPAAALSLLSSAPLLAHATRALTDLYDNVTASWPHRAAPARVEAVAEMLVRLGLSFVLVPGPLAEEPERARAHLDAVLRPLLAGGSSPPG